MPPVRISQDPGLPRAHRHLNMCRSPPPSVPSWGNSVLLGHSPREAFRRVPKINYVLAMDAPTSGDAPPPNTCSSTTEMLSSCKEKIHCLEIATGRTESRGCKLVPVAKCFLVSELVSQDTESSILLGFWEWKPGPQAGSGPGSTIEPHPCPLRHFKRKPLQPPGTRGPNYKGGFSFLPPCSFSH